MITNEKDELNIIHPVIFTPEPFHEGEYYQPIPEEFFQGILPGYVVSTYGKIFNIYTGQYIEEYLHMGKYCRVDLLFRRQGTITTITKAVDRIVYYAFCYNGFYNDNEFIIRHKDKNDSNNYYKNLIDYSVKERYSRKRKWNYK